MSETAEQPEVEVSFTERDHISPSCFGLNESLATDTLISICSPYACLKGPAVSPLTTEEENRIPSVRTIVFRGPNSARPPSLRVASTTGDVSLVC